MGFSRHRILALAIAASAALHGAAFLTASASIAPPGPAPDEPAYTATLARPEPQKVAVAAEPVRRAAPKRRPKPALLPAAVFEPLDPLPEEAAALAAMEEAPDVGMPEATEAVAMAAPATPEVIALAAPVAPPASEAPDAFPVDALPASVSIHYQLTSAIADGRAEYRWDRDGDNYRIQGEAEAEGFFMLFLEGRVLQESRGTVTAAGLRPDRFSEQRPNVAPEGVEFDWPAKQVTFDRNGERKVSALEDNTVDWLSMIFQMAHVPPKARDLDLQVFTQRKLYRFRLKVLGVEEIEIPLGKVSALHLRHEDPVKKEVVDVWLGIDQHFLPVKLRFPAARNRLVVDQVATRVQVR